MRNYILILFLTCLTVVGASSLSYAQQEDGVSTTNETADFSDPVPLTNIPLIPKNSRFYKDPVEENLFGLFPNKRRNINEYLAAQQRAIPLSDAEIAASKAEDGFVEAPVVLTPRVGIDLEQ
jgi:hypothetical protein